MNKSIFGERSVYISAKMVLGIKPIHIIKQKAAIIKSDKHHLTMR